MRHPRSIIAALALAVTIVAGCSSPEPEAPPAPEPAAEVAAELQPYLDALTAIDPGLTVDAERAVNRGENVCLDLEQGKDQAAVVSSAQQRFTGGNATVDAAMAERIVAAVQQHLCS